jgi:hypothetical protein
MEFAAEFRRCLLEADVAGIMRVWAHTNPHLATLPPADCLVALHMARVEAKYIPRKLKLYSLDFLDERGYRKIDGQWIQGKPREQEFLEAAGVASKSNDPRVAKRIVRAMSDAYLHAVAGGITEAPIQKERMLKARAKERSKMGLI